MSLVVKLEDNLGERGDWVMFMECFRRGRIESSPFYVVLTPTGGRCSIICRWTLFLKSGSAFMCGRATNPRKKPGRK